MFNVSDIYTGVGSNKLYGCWTPYVTKFDTSSFYNWEQDNLPIYDLDERTHLLWERLGHPLSATNGFALVVSADAMSGCNTNIFTTLSACLNALPEVINAPFLIEVASFGNLGTLALSNKTFGPRGSIEIINRNFAKAESISTSYAFYKEKTSGGVYGLASSIIYDDGLLNAAIATFEVPSIPINFKKAKVLSLNIPVMSGTTVASGYDARLNGNVTLFCRKAYQAYNQRMTAALAARNSTQPFTKWNEASALVSFTNYESNAASYEVQGYDVSTIKENDASRAEIVWKEESLAAPTIPIAYGNRLNQIKIYNCNGPIYIRNFTVDGGGNYDGTENGIDIRKSVVVLENCSVARCRKTGLYADNSRVTLTRGFIAYRNYGFNSDGTRVGRTWSSKLFQKLDRENQGNYGVGIELINSELNFSSTYERDYLYSISGYVSTYDLPYALSAPQAASWLFCLSRNDIGLRAINSRIFGGRTEANPPTGVAALAGFLHAHNIISELNTEAGVVLQNSTFDHSGRINLYGNYVGLDAANSTISLDSLNCKYNQKEGIYLVNSKINYNKEGYQPTVAPYNDSTYRIHQMSFFQNGTHLRLINSVFEPTYMASMPDKYERFVCDQSFGMFTFSSIDGVNRENTIPAIIADSNSKLKIISLAITNDSDAFDSTNQGYFGAAVSVLNNSEVTLQGTKTYATKIFGPTSVADQQTIAGVYAGQNSTVKIQGPTLIGQFGVDVLVDNNSNLEITPHRLRNGTLDLSGFNLGDLRNHTSVEFHATRACLVADHGSTITMKDLGHYSGRWDKASYGQTVLTYGPDLPGDTYLLQLYTSGGSVQFYPNPNDVNAFNGTTNNLTTNNLSLSLYTNNNVLTTNGLSQNYILPVGQYIGTPASNYQFSSTTNGGVCLRALNGSKVNVDNVHFPCGWWNASSVIYEHNATDGLCSRTFVWMITDSSQLNAKYISVSGVFPADAPYYGPSGVWGPSGAPSSTPDTSGIPVLDYYGKATASSMASSLSGSWYFYGKSSFANQGPFRLYFSVDPAINWATAPGVSAGYIPQVYAQGYQFSSNITIASGVSSLYKSLLFVDGSSVTASGFQYASSVISNPREVRVLLDESAANTFANAKHNTVGKSGLAKVVAAYFPYYEFAGGDTVVLNNTDKPRGQGIGSLNTFDLEKWN